MGIPIDIIDTATGQKVGYVVLRGRLPIIGFYRIDKNIEYAVKCVDGHFEVCVKGEWKPIANRFGDPGLVEHPDRPFVKHLVKLWRDHGLSIELSSGVYNDTVLIRQGRPVFCGRSYMVRGGELLANGNISNNMYKDKLIAICKLFGCTDERQEYTNKADIERCFESSEIRTDRGLIMRDMVIAARDDTRSVWADPTVGLIKMSSINTDEVERIANKMKLTIPTVGQVRAWKEQYQKDWAFLVGQESQSEPSITSSEPPKDGDIRIIDRVAHIYQEDQQFLAKFGFPFTPAEATREQFTASGGGNEKPFYDRNRLKLDANFAVQTSWPSSSMEWESPVSKVSFLKGLQMQKLWGRLGWFGDALTSLYLGGKTTCTVTGVGVYAVLASLYLGEKFGWSIDVVSILRDIAIVSTDYRLPLQLAVAFLVSHQLAVAKAVRLAKKG